MKALPMMAALLLCACPDPNAIPDEAPRSHPTVTTTHDNDDPDYRADSEQEMRADSFRRTTDEVQARAAQGEGGRHKKYPNFDRALFCDGKKSEGEDLVSACAAELSAQHCSATWKTLQYRLGECPVCDELSSIDDELKENNCEARITFPAYRDANVPTPAPRRHACSPAEATVTGCDPD